MITPHSQGVMTCPLCRHTLPGTACYCPRCHAEKHFGPVPRELLSSCMGGLILAPCVAAFIIPLSWWSLPIAIGGVCLGFAFAQYRFNTDRWVRSSSTAHTPGD